MPMRVCYTLPHKVDGHENGRKSCEAEMDVSWDGKRFSASARVWNSRGTDYVRCGQCVDYVAKLAGPADKVAAEILDLWTRYHLNDMRAGSPAQTAWLKANPVPESPSHYDNACAALAEAGLNPDPDYLHPNRKGEPVPYAYGSAWLLDIVPPEDVARIEALLSSLPRVAG